MSARHTPGPWQALIEKPSRREHRGSVMVVAGGQMAIDCNASGDTFDESKANAILIAAAPDLLAALTEAENALSDYVPQLERAGACLSYGHVVLRAARAAIAKATGRSA